jgi:ABC-type sugar transport system substrate-binding protein
MRKISRRDFTRTVALGAGVLASSGTAFAGPKFRITYANLSDEVPFGAAVAAGLKKAGARFPDAELTYLDNRFDAVKAVENARTVVASKPDLFIEYNIQAGANRVIAKLMDEAKIPVLAIQAPVAEAPLFAVDNLAAGTESGRVLAETAKDKWPTQTPVVVIIGLPESGPMFLERGEGAKKAINTAYPGVDMIDYTSQNDAGYVRQLATDTLTRFPNRKVLFWVHVDAMALAALAAVRNSGREQDCLISATGGERAAFPEIRRENSAYVGTYSFFPELWGDDILALAGAMLRKEAVPPKSNPKKQLFVTKQNIDQHYPT